MVIPLVKAATQDWRFLEAPNQFIFKKKGHHLSARKRCQVKPGAIIEKDGNADLMTVTQQMPGHRG
ncbi:MAG: hypothetical protein GY896_08450 [Gammaproteobacteria bacterium]|nr:hypothetical protein [Gammaproteobacteria bacterium]